jgi:hypothetical protein
MSSALSSFKQHKTRPKQSEAGIGATLAYNGIITNVLPPIVDELEGKITKLEKKLDHILDEMQWHPNAISRGTAHPELQAAAAVSRGGQRTRRKRN